MYFNPLELAKNAESSRKVAIQKVNSGDLEEALPYALISVSCEMALLRESTRGLKNTMGGLLDSVADLARRMRR